MRLRAVHAVQDGMAVDEVAKAYHIHRSTLYRGLENYTKKGGNNGLVRKPGSGRPRKLKDLNCDKLKSIV